MGFALSETPRDGLCFFHCINSVVKLASAQDLRDIVADDLLELKSDYCLNGESFLQLRDGLSQEAYAEGVRRGSILPGHLESQMVSDRYGIRLKIYSQADKAFLAFDSAPFSSRLTSRKTLSLLHRDNHYSIIIKS